MQDVIISGGMGEERGDRRRKCEVEAGSEGVRSATPSSSEAS